MRRRKTEKWQKPSPQVGLTPVNSLSTHTNFTQMIKGFVSWHQVFMDSKMTKEPERLPLHKYGFFSQISRLLEIIIWEHEASSVKGSSRALIYLVPLSCVTMYLRPLWFWKLKLGSGLVHERLRLCVSQTMLIHPSYVVQYHVWKIVAVKFILFCRQFPCPPNSPKAVCTVLEIECAHGAVFVAGKIFSLEYTYTINLLSFLKNSNDSFVSSYFYC